LAVTTKSGRRRAPLVRVGELMQQHSKEGSMRTIRSRKRNCVALALLAATATGAVASLPAFSAHRSERGEAILIKTHITFRASPVGEVLRGSFIGDAAFCPGGRFRDRFDGRNVIKTFRCRNGRLTISFLPHPGGPVQSSPWKVVSGSGRFEGLRGHGWMVVRSREGRPPEGRETFTGTVAG
jgi:hypothetical protein